MKDLLIVSPFILAILAYLAFVFAVIMQPIFVWMICHRVKKSNQILRSIDAHLATLAGNKMRPIVRNFTGPPSKVMAEQ